MVLSHAGPCHFAMTLRLFVDSPLSTGAEMDLPAGAARHAQVRRVQPADVLVLFNGQGQDWSAQVLHMGRQQVRVRVGTPLQVHRELPFAVTVAVAVPANERMDTLVEKATELGVARVQPLMAERSVLRLSGERALRKCEHWQAVAVAASEQSGRARVPQVLPVLPLRQWLDHLPPAQVRWLLSLKPGAQPLHTRAVALQAMRAADASAPVTVCALSGPEGGLGGDEERLAAQRGFEAVDLGPRVLRAETAPLAVLAWLTLQPWSDPPSKGG